MPRTECPNCGTPDRIDARDLGREVECRRCRTAYFAEEVATARDRRPLAAAADTRNDGSGAAVSSLLLGLGAVLTWPLCGAGAVLGLGGLVTGFGGLHSRRRGYSIAGLVLSLIGVILSIGMLGFFSMVLSAVGRPLPPNPDGTRPPFAGKVN
jgi:predicted Zn finger-like uncharacterized protein